MFIPPASLSVAKRGMFLQVLDVLGKWSMFGKRCIFCISPPQCLMSLLNLLCVPLCDYSRLHEHFQYGDLPDDD
jgi:hypothetical protein